MSASIAQPPADPSRGVFCNRTLNMRSIKAIGYDMDYTLVHYRVDEWERRAFQDIQRRLAEAGWPVEKLTFDPAMVIRGLIIDTQHGNLLKANRFGFVKKAMHGTTPLPFEQQRQAYSRTIVDLAENRWVFLNTLFSLSEACIYAQLVDQLDQQLIEGTIGYRDLYDRVRTAVDKTHMEGHLKEQIIADPERFIVLDPETALTLWDQRQAGKKLFLITNSDWTYTVAMMSYAFDRFLPKGMSWRNLFDLVIVGARKPEFFTTRSPFFEVATEEGLLRPSLGDLRPGGAYLGGSASQLENQLGLSGDEILYVGDHMFGDVHVTKSVLRWRTALILRELEAEVRALESFIPRETELGARMAEKSRLEEELCQFRLALQRKRNGYGPEVTETERELLENVLRLRSQVEQLDLEIIPLAKAASELSNSRWGLLMRAGNDKSHLARQVERYADIYTSRVSNLLLATPFVYLRSPRGSLPHDPSSPGGPPLTASQQEQSGDSLS